MHVRKFVFAHALICVLILVFCRTAWTAYPEKQIWWVVPNLPGGAADIVSRLVGERLSARFKQPVLIDNRGGAGGVIGTEYVIRSKPDGYTIMVDSSQHVINPSVRQLRYTYTDLTPITQIVDMPLILVVPGDAPYRTLEEFLDFARKNPQKTSYASAGPTLVARLATELFKSVTKVEMMHVPYKGGPPAITAVATGEVSAHFATTPSTLSWIRSGKLRVLAVAAKTRLEQLPDTPTFAELGYPDFVASEWLGLFAPKDTPSDVIQRLNAEVRAIMETPEIKEFIKTKLGIEPVTSTPSEFFQMVRNEGQRWGPIAQELNLKADN